ncbi:hypothetical protein ACFPM0_07310 [Pseudonocardia sulfidoxydans]|uniref:hypothetical protein n=1 Tax=Pseudonocardia sulfidoxydans TaxID=54011 RepID=UPI00361036CC
MGAAYADTRRHRSGCGRVGAPFPTRTPARNLPVVQRRFRDRQVARRVVVP